MAGDQIPEAYALLIDQIRNITHAMNDDNQIAVLIEADILIKTLDEDFIEKFDIKKLKHKILFFLQNPVNNRLLRLNQKIKSEMDTAIEYYDKDLGNDERLFYQEELESDLMELNNEIRTLIAQIIKHKLTDEIRL